MDDDASSLRLAPGVAVPRAALTFTAVAAGGPGGQHANKTATCVELRLPVAAIAGLSLRAVDRLRMLAGSRLTVADEILLSCDETRSQSRNRDLVIERLRELVRDAQAVPKPRRATRPTRGSIERRLRAKTLRSERKRDRRAGE